MPRCKRWALTTAPASTADCPFVRVCTTQKLTPIDDLNLGRADAGKTPGNPNGEPPNRSGVDGSGKVVNKVVNPYSVGSRHRFPDQKVTVCAVYTGPHSSDDARRA